MKPLVKEQWVKVIPGPNISDAIKKCLSPILEHLTKIVEKRKHKTSSDELIEVKIYGASQMEEKEFAGSFDISVNHDKSCMLYIKIDKEKLKRRIEAIESDSFFYKQESYVTIHIVFNDYKYNGIMLNEDSSSLFYLQDYKLYNWTIFSIEGIEHLNTSMVKNMSKMFCCCSIKELDLSNFNTSNVTDMSEMFWQCCLSEKINLSSFDTSNVENMSFMFASTCLESLDLSNFKTSKVKDMSAMFANCEYLKHLNVSSFNTSNVENMRSMFEDSCLGDFNLLHFNTSKVRDVSYMFDRESLNDDDLLEELDLSTWDLSNVEKCEGVFSNRHFLAKVKLKAPYKNIISEIKKDLGNNCIIIDAATGERIE